MEQIDNSTTREWHAYVAGFFDGEGSVTIARVRASGKSDYHKVIATLTQSAKHRAVLDAVMQSFGGSIVIRRATTRVGGNWMENAVWQCQGRADIVRFLTAVQPYIRIKAQQVKIALEFMAITADRNGAYNVRRGQRGFILGRVLTENDIAQREALRVAIQHANERSPRLRHRSQLPPLFSE